MPSIEAKTLAASWNELLPDDADWACSSHEMAFRLLQLHTIRRFEENLLVLKGRHLINGPVHSAIGQEAVAVGATAALGTQDQIVSTHRAHHHFLAMAMRRSTPPHWNPLRDEPTDELRNVLHRTLAEIMGLAPGWCGGRGGSMHLHAPHLGILGTSAIVGGGIAIATGAAWAKKHVGGNGVVIVFIGDGAVNQGIFHEAINLGALWESPAIYFIENNLYGVATSTAEAAHVGDGLLSQRALAYDLPALVVDGMDPMAVTAATEKAVNELRTGGHPFVIEALTYRFFHHAGDLPGHGFGYRSKDEETSWRKRDPLVVFGQELIRRAILSGGQVEDILNQTERLVLEAVASCTEDNVRVRPNLQPDPATVEHGLRSDGSEFADITFSSDDPAEPTQELSYVQAIAAVLGRRMETDERVFVLGEEVGHMGGGPYRATWELSERFPGRVLNTPISESGFCGFAAGAAMAGLRPVVELMFPDFGLVAADQLFNHIAKLRHMYGGKSPIPLVVRTRMAIGCGYGGQHSGDPVALFSLFPGWRIVAPTTSYDYIGMFNSAMRCEDPVLIVEDHVLYDRKGLVPEDRDYFLPLDRARRVRAGSKVTVLAYGGMVGRIETLLGDDDAVDVIDLRALDPAHVDYGLIGDSLTKTGMLVIADTSTRSESIAPAIACECQARFFDALDGPMLRITGANAPKPVSRVLEDAAVPSDETIRAVLDRAVRRG